jgi:hypothetical protein
MLRGRTSHLILQCARMMFEGWDFAGGTFLPTRQVLTHLPGAPACLRGHSGTSGDVGRGFAHLPVAHIQAISASS